MNEEYIKKIKSHPSGGKKLLKYYEYALLLQEEKDKWDIEDIREYTKDIRNIARANLSILVNLGILSKETTKRPIFRGSIASYGAPPTILYSVNDDIS